MGILRAYLLLALALLPTACIGSRSADPARIVRGPLPTGIQHPLAQVGPQMRPRRPAIEPVGSWSVGAVTSYTSVFESAARGNRVVLFDGEALRTVGRVRTGVAEGIDVEIELPFLYGSGGFLDHFLDELHEALGLPNQGREKRPENTFDMRLEVAGRTLYELEPYRLGLQDVPIFVTGRIGPEREEGWTAAWRAVVELPTGSEERGLGNGRLDWGAGLLFEYTRDRWSTFLAADGVAVGTPEAFDGSGVELEDRAELLAALEYRWNDRASLVGQMFAISPIVTDIDLEEIDEVIANLSLGAAWDTRWGARVAMAFQEDVVAATGPDFAVVVAVAWGF